MNNADLDVACDTMSIWCLSSIFHNHALFQVHPTSRGNVQYSMNRPGCIIPVLAHPGTVAQRPQVCVQEERERSRSTAAVHRDESSCFLDVQPSIKYVSISTAIQATVCCRRPPSKTYQENIYIESLM